MKYSQRFQTNNAMFYSYSIYLIHTLLNTNVIVIDVSFFDVKS